MLYIIQMLFLSSQLKIEHKSDVKWRSQLSTENYPNINRIGLAGDSCGSLNGVEWTCQKNCSVTPYLIRKGWVITCSGQGRERVICCPRVDKLAKYVDLTKTSISEQKCQDYQAQVCSSKSGVFLRNRINKKHHGFLKKLRPSKASRTGVDRFNKDLDGDKFDEIFANDVEESTDVVQVYNGKEAESGEFPYAVSYDIFDNEVEESTDVVQVYNGKEAESGEFPYAALIGYRLERIWRCGGTLISDRFVLSAAHCSEPGGNLGPARWVRLGDLDHATESDNVKPQDFFIVQRFLPPNYDKDLIYNDIVLFRLDHRAVFDQFVSPACLHRDLTDPPGTVTAAGWGRTVIQGPPSSKLMKVELNSVEAKECNKRINDSNISTKEIPSGIDGRTMICAWERDRDTCDGDSGGPLVITDSPHCLGQLVGITAFGPNNCDSSEVPGMYTRVSAFLPWLESIVWTGQST